MNGIVSASIEEYMEKLIPQRDKTLMEMEEVAEREEIPIVGPQVGTLLNILAHLAGANKILELGTAIGYSTTWLARGLSSEAGRVVTIEGNSTSAQRAKGYLSQAGVAERVSVMVGNALEIVPTLKDKFDLIFVDINKEDYPTVLPQCVDLLRDGGLLVTDNVLWGGMVASDDTSSSTQAIREYNRLLSQDSRMLTTIVPLRDGVSISIKG
ncbi:MAG: O-methyltransferase [Dehalococcoidia bacterium]